MKIKDVFGCPYEDVPGSVTGLRIMLDEDETIGLGDKISIPMMDGTCLSREVRLIDPRRAGDFGIFSKQIQAEVDAGLCGVSRHRTSKVSGECSCSVYVMDVPCNEVETDRNIAARQIQEEQAEMIDLTPYREFGEGGEADSITAHTREGYTVPEKVLVYLQVGEAYMMCPGMYEHPFKPGVDLLGPYLYTDGRYFWDRDTWKYVLKYGLILPDDFIEHVMSDAGTAFIEKRLAQEDGWAAALKELKWREGMMCLLPDDAGNVPLEAF